MKISFLIGVLILAASPGWAAGQEDWPFWGGDAGGARWSALDQINTGNVRQLQRVWTYETGETPINPVSPVRRRIAFEATPLMIDGVLYFTTPSSRVVALDADRGREIWKFDPQAGSANRKYEASRGVAFWQNADGSDRRILYGTLDARLIALDARTGKPIATFGDNGAVALRAGAADDFPNMQYEVTSPPAVWHDLVICGSAVPEYPSRGPSGLVRAFDVRTGKLVWTFHTVAQPGEPGHETWTGNAWKNRTGANVWSIMSVDHERGMVFLPVGSASYDFYGADRKGADLYTNCVVALDAATGKVIWHFQVVHHDVWDYDPPSQPLLATVRREGRAIPAVVEVTKMGFVFVLDRMTGKPLFPVEERPVPQSAVPGEATWPTQPFPVLPAPLSRMTVAKEDVYPTPFCTDLFAKVSNHGMFTPYGEQLTLVMPGTLGGATWSGASFDAASGRIYVNSNEVGAIGYMKKQPAGAPERYRRASPWGEYARFWDPKSDVPCQRPPWGKLTAINLDDGSVVWQRPLGNMPGVENGGVETGTPNLGGSIATAGGLVFIGATMDHRFRAFDAKTGAELWSTDLPASAHATPITYRGPKTGKQYVVIAAGGGGFFEGPGADDLIAFALP